MDEYCYDISVLKRAMMEHGLTLNGLAKKADVLPSTLCRLFGGQNTRATSIAKVAAALDVELSDIVVPVNPQPVPSGSKGVVA